MKNKEQSYIIEFYGKECPHCEKMREIASAVESDLGIFFERKEIWHDQKNDAFFELCDNMNCGGVPFFYNKKTKKGLCGEATYEELIMLVKGN